MFKNKTQCNKTRKDEVRKIAKALNLNFDKSMKKDDLCKLILKHLKKSSPNKPSPNKPSAGGKKPSPGKKNKCTAEKITKCNHINKLCNPESGKCVKKDGKIGKQLLAQQGSKPSPAAPGTAGAAAAESPKKPSPGKKNKCTAEKIGKCKHINKLCNPASGKCVKKDGKIGKQLLAQQGREPSPAAPGAAAAAAGAGAAGAGAGAAGAGAAGPVSPNERAMLLARLEKLNRVLLNIKSEKDELLDKYLASGRTCDENVNNCNKDEVCDYQMRRCMKLSKNEETVLGNGVEIREIGGKKIIGTREVLNNLARLFATSAGDYDDATAGGDGEGPGSPGVGGYADAAGSPGVGGAAGSPGVGGEDDEDVEAIIRQLEAGRTNNLSKVNQQILRCLGLM